MGDIIVLAVLGAVVILAAAKLRKDKKKVRRRADVNKSNMKSRSVFRAAGVHCGIFYLSIYPFPRTATMNFASKRSSSFLRIYLI